jgi:hypothetical protein
MTTQSSMMETELRKSGEEETGLKALLSPSEAFFSISVHPLLLGDYSNVGACSSGCVVTVSASEENIESSSLLERMKSKLQSEMQAPRKIPLHAVEHMLQHQTDDCMDVMAVVKKYSESTRPMAGQDEVEWFVGCRSTSLRSYAFLRRLAMPMHLHVLGTGSNLKQLPFSFLDLILELEVLRSITGSHLLSRIDTLEKEQSQSSKSPREIEMLKKLRTLLIRTIARAGVRSTIQCDSNKLDASDGKGVCDSYAIPERMREEVVSIRVERKRLLKELEERKKNEGAEISHFSVGGKIKLPYRIHNGCLLVTENELSHEEFCNQTKLMTKVNKTLPRPFHPGVSRPRLQKVELSTKARFQLRSIFFDSDGSLRDSILDDIDLSTRHGYINFANASCQDQRNDYRWQVPIKRHTMRVVAVRSAVESLFSEQKILLPGHEKIHDLGILIGGTEDQSIHHDIPRQTTSWLPEEPSISEISGVPVTGWEFDRAAYNEAMASPYAPSSILLGMSDSGEVNLGVQKNQIERYEYVRKTQPFLPLFLFLTNFLFQV